MKIVLYNKIGKLVYSFLIFTTILFIDHAYSQDSTECGTMQSLQRYLELGVPEARPTLSSLPLSITTNHFKIHYTLSNSDSITGRHDSTTQTWADSTAVYAETCWVRSVRLGWATPPPDNSEGGDSLYDIYIMVPLRGGFGETPPQYAYADTSFHNSYTSFMRITPDSIREAYPKYARLRALIAHEFSHACQFRYSGNIEANFIYENTSVYMERVMYHETNDVNTLPHRLQVDTNPLSRPDYSIKHYLPGDTYPYAGALWPTFLSEFYDSTVMRRAWEKMGETAGENTLSAFDDVLSASPFNKSLVDAMVHYAVWRYFTGERADSFHYKFASNYPTSDVAATLGSYPSDMWPEFGKYPKGDGGTNYIEYKNGHVRLSISFIGSTATEWAVVALGIDSGKSPVEYEIPVNQNSGWGDISIQNKEYDRVVVIPVNIGTDSSASYTLHVEDAPYKNIKFVNMLDTLNIGGTLLRAESDTINSGNTVMLEYDTPDSVRTLNERFVVDSVIKHHHWDFDVAEHKLKNIFDVLTDDDKIAYFEPLKVATIRNELLDAPSVGGGIIGFRDPWYLHSNGTQPDSFFNDDLSGGSFRPTGAHNQNTGGVFLDQRMQDSVYYSVSTLDSQLIGSYVGKFINWTSVKGSLCTDSTSLTTPVIFKTANDTVKAIYKGHLLSSAPNVTKSNGQRKLCYIADTYYMIYESGGKIWFTKSTDEGTTWTPETKISDDVVTCPP